MKRINSAAELEQLHKDASNKQNGNRRIMLCAGGGCIASGAMEVKKALQAEAEKIGLDVPIIETGCLGPCSRGPVLRVDPDGVMYEQVSSEDAQELIQAHFTEGGIYHKLVHRNMEDGEEAAVVDDIDFFQKQKKLVLRNCGAIDPMDLQDAISAGTYQALSKVLTNMKPEEVIEELKESGLRGRGGAGFPTWLKWNFTYKAKGDKKYVLCNADEGDPGAYMDRSVLEGDPHSVIEGMAIAAYTVGADQGYVYVRAEYPLAVSRLREAINQAREAGILGHGSLGTNFSFDLDIRMGSGAFVCGEETALIHSIEGKRGEPRPRPPFPAVKGLWDKPTLLNNVETYANIAVIIKEGGKKFADLGTEKSKGTKVFALAGSVQNTGLVEVPIGTPLGELVYDIGGGVKGGKEFKAAQVGGPSGGCVPKENLNISMDYESLKELGAIMGSGGLIIMDDDTCMVDVARYFLEFVQEESCGKCVPCRVGTKRMLEILERICSGEGEEEDIDRLIHLGEQIQDTSLCGLGQTAPNPVLSTIRHFREEYEEHIRDKHCRAGVCPDLVRAPCQSGCPAGVDVPGFVSLVAEKRYAEALQHHRERNPFAAVCARVCFHTCEDKCRRATLDEPVAIRSIKRFMVDQEIVSQTPEVRENEENAKRQISIVGGGPAGLSCAYFLARLGYRPKVYEASSRPGGMLVQTIPAYRLPRETMAREIRMIENMGVDIETGVQIGKDLTLEEIREQGADAVFVGVGAPECRGLGLPGEDADSVVMAVPFLREYNIRGSVPVGKKVVVVGGGNAAIDAARTALRLGAEVTILYRRSREEMPAYAEEVDEALNEGVELHDLTHIMEIKKDSKGKVAGVECVPMELGEFDRSGRRHPKIQESGKYSMDCDQVILAIGQFLQPKRILGDLDVVLNDGGFIKADPVSGQTSQEWLYAGGDAVTGSSSVVNAIAAGERAAVGIDTWLTGEDHAFWREEKTVDTFFDPEAEPAETPREDPDTIPVDKRRYNFDEVEKPWNEATAIRQALRCLRCDYGKESSNA
ncbi:MAG: NADH-quinone oxidoreductase subunit NuoF [Spirochaetales bacterium]|nr:NADH-quinone oxidoreductase subunit NuoF [Spirochaetales bacterium]MCF7938525.1 NADH-quinone oxidoreductase subunit NuoF [Spirochaetales bacterium]